MFNIRKKTSRYAAIRQCTVLFGIFVLSAPVAGFQESRSAKASEKIIVGQTDSIEFDAIYEAILKEADIDYEMMVVPSARKRRMFVEGKIVIDCCAAVAWRQKPEEIAVQLHSKTFIQSAEHYFYHADSDITVSDHKDLKNFRLSIVRSYVYRGDRYFKNVVPANDIAQMMTLVSLKRAELGIINPYDFQRRMEKHPMPLRLGGQHEASSLTIRVHKSRAELLPRINAVIDRYLAEGLIDDKLRQAGAPFP